MDLRSYSSRLLRRWRVFLVVFVVVGAALTGAGFLVPVSYEASVRVVVAPNLAPGTPIETRQIADLYLTSRMKTYAQLATTNQVLQPVIDSLGLDTTVIDLAEDMDVTIPSGTSVIDLAVSAPTADQAAATANRIANEMPWAVANLEGAATVAESPVQVSVLQPADIPLHRSSPKTVLNIVIAIGLAFIAGVFAALVVDNYDTRVRRRRDVTGHAPYLGGIPKAEHARSRDLLDFSQQSADLQAVLRRISIDILYAVGTTPARLLFTSPRTGAGKTMVAANVAGALTEAGNRVLFVDADVRGGRLAAQVGLPQTRGITDLVSGRIGLDESVFRMTRAGFAVIPCGGSAIDVGEMLAGERFAELMRVFAERYDVVIVDAPPVNNLSDASRFTQNITDVVVVAEAVTTRRAELMRVTGSLRQAGARTLGVVLSQARHDEDPAAADQQQVQGATDVGIR
ncbi:polysaccharide biosynthesis tyrosine autokinase [Mycobacterium sp. WMMD1722]|uniref:polysaccharide biosynthesis tyrosine autokinase n=1 Tax=Mycobacterium sp. WMMD1722 TaxID=3404117 RepID=UPI003BF51C7F